MAKASPTLMLNAPDDRSPAPRSGARLDGDGERRPERELGQHARADHDGEDHRERRRGVKSRGGRRRGRARGGGWGARRRQPPSFGRAAAMAGESRGGDAHEEEDGPSIESPEARRHAQAEHRAHSGEDAPRAIGPELAPDVDRGHGSEDDAEPDGDPGPRRRRESHAGDGDRGQREKRGHRQEGHEIVGVGEIGEHARASAAGRRVPLRRPSGLRSGWSPRRRRRCPRPEEDVIDASGARGRSARRRARPRRRSRRR